MLILSIERIEELANLAKLYDKFETIRKGRSPICLSCYFSEGRLAATPS